MIFVPIMFLVALPSYVLHGILASITATIPTGVWTVLDYIFSIPRQLDGVFPFMITLTEALLFFFLAWCLHASWRIFNSLMSYMPSWFPGANARMPEQVSEDNEIMTFGDSKGRSYASVRRKRRIRR